MFCSKKIDNPISIDDTFSGNLLGDSTVSVQLNGYMVNIRRDLVVMRIHQNIKRTTMTQSKSDLVLS